MRLIYLNRKLHILDQDTFNKEKYADINENNYLKIVIIFGIIVVLLVIIYLIFKKIKKR